MLATASHDGQRMDNPSDKISETRGEQEAMKFSPKQKRTLGKEQNDAFAVEQFYQLSKGAKERWMERAWRELHR